MNRIVRLIPGVAAVLTQLEIWRTQLEELRPIYPIALPVLLWVFARAYRSEQERMRLERLDPVLRPEKRLPENKPSNG